MGIVDDQTYESDEHFVVRLGDPIGSDYCHAQVGKNDSTTITILDTQDGECICYYSSLCVKSVQVLHISNYFQTI